MNYIKDILEIIVMIYIVSLIFTTITIILNKIFFKNEYSYNNIKLYTAKPIDEIEVNDLLINVYNRAIKSTLYKSKTNYIVCLVNSKNTDRLYFRTRDILINFKNIILDIKNIRKKKISSEIFNKSLFGYVLPIDIKGTAFVRHLDVMIITHELAHQMVMRSIKNPLISLYSILVNRTIHEGYANLIGYDGMDLKYSGSRFIGRSSTCRVENLIHEDGKHYRHSYRTVNWGKTKNPDNYSTENMLIVRNLLLNNNITNLVKNINSRKKLKTESNNFYLSCFQTSGYQKIKGDPNILEGTWVKFSCDYEGNKCKYRERNINGK